MHKNIHQRRKNINRIRKIIHQKHTNINRIRKIIHQKPKSVQISSQSIKISTKCILYVPVKTDFIWQGSLTVFSMHTMGKNIGRCFVAIVAIWDVHVSVERSLENIDDYAWETRQDGLF
jgi:ABC-type Mn2+/Zn2+ transport system ATPase subunit